MNKKLMGIITSLTVVAMFAACGTKEETPETPGTKHQQRRNWRDPSSLMDLERYIR